MSKGLILIALLVLLAVLSVRAFVKIMEPRYLFHPSPALTLKPSLVGLEYKDAYIRSGKYLIHGWYFPAKDAQGFIVFFHGNAGNMSDRLEFIKFIRPLRMHTLMIDYRGYGISEGRPTIDGVDEDAVAAVEWLTGKLKAPTGRVILWGRSLGGAAALTAAERYPQVAGVILESSFVSLRRIAMDIAPHMPVAFVTDAFDNAAILSRLETPKLIIHGLDDTLIPFRHAEELYSRAAPPKKILPIKGAGHDDTYLRGGGVYLKAIEEWTLACMRDDR